jgi:hypothetical protein
MAKVVFFSSFAKNKNTWRSFVGCKASLFFICFGSAYGAWNSLFVSVLCSPSLPSRGRFVFLGVGLFPLLFTWWICPAFGEAC